LRNEDGDFKTPFLDYLKGNAEFKQGNFKEAVKLYTVTLGKNERNPLVLTNRAMAQLKLKK